MGMYSDEYYVALTKSGNIKADHLGRAYAAKSKSMVEQMLTEDDRNPAKYKIEKLMLAGK